MKRTPLLFSYIKRIWLPLVGFFVFAGLFALLFYLYRVPVQPVWYAFILCLFLGIAFFLAGFYRYFQRHLRLNELKMAIPYSINGLPEPKDQLEQDYQELITQVFEEKMREESQWMKSKNEMFDYYSMWAHQIKTPIAAIRLLLQTSEERENQELLEELFSVEQYVEMVLQFLRSEGISSDLRIAKYPLDSLIRQAVKKYARIFIRKKLELKLEETDLCVLTDEKWLVFVLEQLLSNALKYTKEGYVRIYRDRTRDKGLIIEDTGIGIKKEDLPRIFERGFTGYNGRMDKRSTGIGLYLTKKVLDRLGHRITIESEPGAGCRVYLDLSESRIRLE